MKIASKTILMIIGLTVLIGSGFVYSGPPSRKVKVTVVNKCDWDVPVGLGRNVNMYWFDDEEKAKVAIKRVPAGGTITFDDVEAGITDFTFIVFNETTNRYQYNMFDWKFLRDAVITVTYNDDKMEYEWEKEDKQK